MWVRPLRDLQQHEVIWRDAGNAWVLALGRPKPSSTPSQVITKSYPMNK
jgi:hypothetical protein